MSLIPYDPFRQLDNVKRDFDRFFSDFPFFKEGREFGGVRVDVQETDREVIVSCDIPGLEKKEDVNIEVENNRLTVSGTIQRAQEVKDEELYRKERFTGRFHRTVPLPSAVSAEGVRASYKNGVLVVTMPKMEQKSRRKIDVEFH
ncbi:Hsp20/alpha crystallin family protein [Bacillaceae bacterium Marseille-Q3522]|nr:Hsp20/alpha crystallin family protein [Bacillaceae bacterium Marseille-Q3522]